MIIRTALTADNHFNLPKRSDEAKRILNWMLEDWKAREVHLIGFAGDLADGPMTERDRAWLIDYIDRCALVAPVVVCDGNHEIELSLRNALSGRATKYPILVEDGGDVHPVDTTAGKIAVACLSFPKKAKLLAHVGPVSNEDAERIAGEALQDVCRGLGIKVARLGLPTVALVHGTIRGSKISADQPDRPLGLDISLSTLDLTGADFTVCGHIHLQQSFTFNGRDYVVPGSPFFSDFGESKYDKGYVLAEFETDGYYGGPQMLTGGEPRTVYAVKWSRIPTPATPMLLLEEEWAELPDGGQGWRSFWYEKDWIDGKRSCWPSFVGCDIRFRYRFPGDQRKSAAMAADSLRQCFLNEGAINVTLDPVLIPTTRSRIPQLATTPRLEDKWLLYCQAIGLELSDARKAVLLDYLRLLQEEAAAMGLAMGTTGRAAPTLRKARLKSFLKFPNEVSINFDELDGPLTTIIAPNECLAGNTLVDVPRDMRTYPDGIPIRELVGTSPLVYSYDGERLVVTRACNVRKTGTQRAVYRVKFTAEPKRIKRGLLPPMEITATEEHPFMLRDGSYRLLRDLLPGDSLMPLYRNKEGAYLQIHRNDGSLEDEHRLVGAFLKGEALLTSEHAHHDDHNTWNNCEGNIKVLTASEHSRLHSTGRPPTYDIHPRGMLGKRHTEDARRQIGETFKRTLEENPGIRTKMGIKARAAWQARRPRDYHKLEVLKDLYVDQGLSTIAIAESFNTDHQTILYWLKQHGITRRVEMTRCPNGHEYTTENTFIDTAGYRRCLLCFNATALRKRLKRADMRRAARLNHTVVSVDFAGYEDVYDLEVPKYHNFVANGVVVHNCGKSVLMGLIGPGVLYGDTANRGSLDDLSVATDSFVEVEFVMGGAEYKLVQNANGKDRKGSVSLLKNKQPELSKAGRREYAEWGSKHLLPRNVYDAIICQSGTESVIDMKDGPRVELLLRVLGLEIYEALAESARKKAAEVSGKLSGVRSRIEEIGTVDLSALTLEVDTNEKRVGTAQSQLKIIERELSQNRIAAQEVEKQRAEYNSLAARRGELAEQVSKLRVRVTELTTKIEVNKEVTDQAEVIEAAGVEMVRLGQELAVKATIDQDLRLRYSEVHADRTALESRRDDTARRRDQSQVTVDELTARLADVDTRRKDARAVLKSADVIRNAVTETASLQASLKTKEEEFAQLRTQISESASALNDVRASLRGITQRQGELERRITTAKPLADTKEFVLQAVEDAKRLTGDIETVRTEILRYKTEIGALELTLSTSTTKRISTLRDGHHDIVGGLAEPVARAMKALSDDDDVEAEEQDTPPRLTEVKTALGEAEQRLHETERALRIAQTSAGNLPFVEKAEAETKESLDTLETLLRESHDLIKEGDQISARGDELNDAAGQAKADIGWLQNKIEGYAPLVAKAEILATAETRIQGLDEQRASITADLKAATASVSELAAEVLKLEGEIGIRTDTLRRIEGEQAANESVVDSLNRQMVVVKELAAKAPLLNDARARIEELSHQKAGLDSEHETLEHEHDKLERHVDGTTLPESIALAPFEAAVTSARQSLTDYQIRLATARKELSDAEAKEGRRQELASQVRGLEEQVSNWSLLGQHLGKDALQKAEIDASAETLVELTNDLLRAAGDTRHTLVSIETERLHSDGKRMVPCLNINIYDSDEAATKESRRLSDAGKIIVGWPFSKALVLLGCQRAGLTGPTIMVDESTGVCDKDNGPRVIAMLRRFADILKCRVIYISQQVDLQDLADSKIFIKNGVVTTT